MSPQRHLEVKRSPPSKNEGPPSKRPAPSALTQRSAGLRGRGKYLPKRHFPWNAFCL